MTELTPIKQIKATALPNGINKSHLSSKRRLHNGVFGAL